MSESTLETLLDRRASFLSFVQHRVNDRALAEDILQVAYMRALEHGDTIAEKESAVAWFYSVLRNALIDHYRRRATESTAMERLLFELGDEEPAVPAEETRTFVCGCIEHVLPMMKDSYAEALREVDLGEKPLAEFAKAHGVTPGNAAVRVHRARAALRKELAQFCGACTLHACLYCVCKTPNAGAEASNRK